MSLALAVNSPAQEARRYRPSARAARGSEICRTNIEAANIDTGSGCAKVATLQSRSSL